MITRAARSSRMSAALIMASPPNTSTESFDALYRECARDMYAYVRTLLGDDASRRGRHGAGVRARLPPPGDVRRPPRQPSAAGSSGSRATRRSTSCVGASARRRCSASCPTTPRARPRRRPSSPIRRTTVRVALAALAPRDRELVALKFHGGLSNAELAAVLGTSESNAGTRVHRAVSKLREACNAPS